MGQITSAIKATFRIGGTGQAFLTPRANDVVYVDPWSVDAVKVAGINVTAERAMSYIPFFAAVRNISEDVAGLPLGVYRATSEGREQDRAHPLHRVLHDAPNPYMTSFTFRETLQAHMLTWGNGYAEIEYGTDGSVLGLWPLRPDRMEVVIDQQANAPLYRYTIGSRVVEMPWRKVFHVHGLGFDGLMGYSILTIARGMLGVALAGEKHSQTDFARGTVPPAILKTTGKLSPEAKQNLRESWDSLDHRDRVAILEEGLDLQVIGVPAKDNEFMAQMQMPRSLMATLLRMPPHMLQDVDRSTSWGTGIDSQTLGYTKFTLRPWVIRWEQAGKQQLIAEDDRYLRHNMTAIERGDTRTRWFAYEAGLRSGVYTPNRILEMEDENPIGPDGDIRLVPLNMVPLDQARNMSLRERVEMLGALVRAGFDPAASARQLDVPEIEHTGLEPVTVTEQG